MRTALSLGLSLALLVPALALAEVKPRPGAYDPRVKTVDYNADDVVHLVGHYGFSTNVQFGDDEVVQSIALGDSLAWEVAPRGNQLFVKPREDNATTNMTVITDARTYQFWLDAAQARNKGRGSEMYFRVRFTYPREAAERARAEADKQEATLALTRNAPVKNWNYHACGNARLRPIEAYDDGRFTYLRFPGSQQIPAAFVINSDGSETLANGTMRGDQLILQLTAPKILLRKGRAVACLENRSYNWYGIYNTTGTTSPDVLRRVRSEAVPQPPSLPAADPAVPPPEDEDDLPTGPIMPAMPIPMLPLPQPPSNQGG